MIAEIALKEGNGGQIISCLNRFLFRGKTKQVLTVIFFVLMAVILVTNLAAYISGAEEIIVGLLPIPSIAAKLLFYVVAASVVLFGLKAVGVSEKIAVTVIFALIAALAAASLLNIRNPLSLSAGSLNDALAYYGLAMFAMSAFFSVPQAVEGLSGDTKKNRKAGFLDLMRTAGGLIAIIIAVMVVPAYHNARRDVPENNLLRRSGLPLEIMIVIAYILMAVGSVVPV